MLVTCGIENLIMHTRPGAGIIVQDVAGGALNTSPVLKLE
jgi:hypothetical protein